MTAWQTRAASFVAGLAFALGQPPFDLWPVAVAALVAGIWLGVRAPGARQAGWVGWTFGLGYFGLSMLWIVDPFLVEPEVTGWMAPFAVLGLSGGLSLFWALAFWAGRRIGHPAALVAAWTLAELARGYVLTGFPWGLVGYALAPSPAVFLAAVVGPYGLAMGLLACCAALASRGWAARLSGGAALAAALVAGPMLQPPEQDLSGRPLVRLVQPNAVQRLKWDPAHARTYFFRQVDFTGAGKAPDLVVWPETALPMFLHDADDALAVIADAARGAPVVLGVQRVNDADRYFNSLLLMDGQGRQTALYDKHHLVPFGEYIPLAQLFTGIEIGGIAARARGGYTPGPGPALIETPAGRALPLICYEAVFPQDVLAAPDRPDYLLQITNDAWFGSWSGPYQHLMQARMRSIETGLPLVRAANTGVSAVIDPGGRLVGALALDTDGWIDLPLPRSAPRTLYARAGDGPVLALALALLGAATLRRRRKSH